MSAKFVLIISRCHVVTFASCLIGWIFCRGMWAELKILRTIAGGLFSVRIFIRPHNYYLYSHNSQKLKRHLCRLAFVGLSVIISRPRVEQYKQEKRLTTIANSWTRVKSRTTNTRTKSAISRPSYRIWRRVSGRASINYSLSLDPFR